MSNHYEFAKRAMNSAVGYTERGLLKGVIAANLAIIDELRIQRGAEPAPEPLNVWNIYLLTRKIPNVPVEVVRAYETSEKAEKEADRLNVLAEQQGLGIQWNVAAVPLTRG